MELIDAEEKGNQFAIKQIESDIQNKSTTETTVRKNQSFHSVRYLIVVFGGFALGAMFFTRLSCSIALVSMVNHTYQYDLEYPEGSKKDFFEPGYIEVGEFNWSNEIQQIINTGYMIFYTLPQIYTAKLSMKYGIRVSISLGLAICSLSCIMTPVAAYHGWVWVLLLRCFNGLGASAMFPSMIASIENWMPYSDSAFGLSLMQFFATIIQIATPLISGYLTSIHWKWAFYGPGFTSLIFALIWWLVVRDTPDLCPFISQYELDKIKDDPNASKDVQIQKKKPKRTDVPWYFMMKVGSFYGMLATWIIYCVTAGSPNYLLPQYFHRVLKVSVKENGFYMFAGQFGMMFSMLWPNPMTNFLQRHFSMSITAARRAVVILYTSMYAVTLGYMAVYHEFQIILLAISRFFHNTNDTLITSTLMSQYGLEGLSGMVYSVMNSVGNFFQVVFCWIAGRFLDATGESLDCWSWIFIIQILFNLVLALIYIIWIKSEPISVAASKKSAEDGKKSVDIK